MRLILLGPPGAGKGTQASFLARQYGIEKLSMGDMLRDAAQRGDDLAEKLQKIMSSGALVDDEIIIEIIKKEIVSEKCAKGFILDGFPRTINQAKSLDEMLQENNLKLDSVIEISVNYDVLAQRISGRFSCANCGEGYHDMHKKPKKDGVCDVCGGKEFTRRADDNIQTVAKRLQVYQEQTAPLLPYYETKNLLKKIDGIAEMQVVEEQIKQLLASI